MSSPALTPAEDAAIKSVVETIRAAQSVRPTYAQVRLGSDSGFTQLGIAPDLLAGAKAAGFSGRVDEYRGPSGTGWCLVVRLVRDGVTWERTHHDGPETWRERGWRVVPEGMV